MKRRKETKALMRVILNGDDFGITHACNLAIIDCYKNGMLNSTSMMTNMDGCIEAAKLWKDNPGLSVGIHLCLTAGKPLTNAATLIKEDGTFDKRILCNSDHVSLYEMEEELNAQIDRFIELNGKLPDHINSHHGIEQIRGGKEILVKLSEKYDRPIRCYIDSNEATGAPFEQAMIPVISFHPGSSINDGYQPEELIRALDEAIRDLDQNNLLIEIALHPGYVDSDLMRISSLNVGRIYDSEFFCSSELKTWLDQKNARTITYKDLQKIR